MIPIIEDILSDLVKGAITMEQALAWIKAHLDLAYETGQESMIGDMPTGQENK